MPNPRNPEVLQVNETVDFHPDAIVAMRTLCPDDSIGHWTADKVLDAIRRTDNALPHWRRWMSDRYFAE